MIGMMLMQDGSTHRWTAVLGHDIDLIVALDEVLCVQEDRQVGRDNYVSWSGRSLQIPEQRHRRHYVKAVVCARIS